MINRAVFRLKKSFIFLFFIFLDFFHQNRNSLWKHILVVISALTQDKHFHENNVKISNKL